MVDLERSSKLKAYHELLPLAPRLRTERPFMEMATETACIKKGKKNRGYSVRAVGAGNLLTKIASQERVSWEDKSM